MRYTFFLNGERGLYVLKKLLKEKYFFLVKVVFCRKSIKKELQKVINLKKTKYLANINQKKSLIELNSHNTDLFLIAGYPQIFSGAVLKIPKKMTINLHGGPIPKYRGGSPLNWQIINNEKKIGLSILEVNKEIDGGRIIEKVSFPLKKNDDIGSVHKKANYYFFKILLKTLKKLYSKNKKLTFIKKKGKSKYWHQRNDEDGQLDYNVKTAKECYNFIRAITKPYPGAWIRYKNNNKNYKIRLYNSMIIKKKTEKKIIFKNNAIYIGAKDYQIKVTNFKIFND